MYRKALLVFLAFLVSCSSTEQSQVIESSTTTESIPTTETITPSTTEGVKNTSTTTIELPVLSVSATIESAPNSPIAASIDIQSSNPVAVQVTATSDNHQVATPRTSSYSSSHTFPLVGLRQSQSYNIEISTIDEYEQTSNLNMGSFVTGEIDYPLPDFDLFVDPERAQPGVTLLEYNPWVDITRFGLDLALIGLDNEGQVVLGKEDVKTTIGDSIINCTSVTTFKYNNIELNHCMDWERIHQLSSGLYQVNLIFEGNITTQTTFKLR